MSRESMKAAYILCTSLLLHGCATPQPVLDLATRGVSATTMAEAELERYLAAAQDQLSARVVVVRQLSTVQLEQSHEQAFSNFLRDRTNDRQGQDIVDLTRLLGQERRRLREQMLADSVKLDEGNRSANGVI